MVTNTCDVPDLLKIAHDVGGLLLRSCQQAPVASRLLKLPWQSAVSCLPHLRSHACPPEVRGTPVSVTKM